MLNCKVSSAVASLCLASSLLIGLYSPQQIRLIPSAAADTVAPDTKLSPPQLNSSGASAPDPQVQLNALFQIVANLVKKYYPKANITISDSSMHFDKKCRLEDGYYSGRMVLAPQTGGVLCDIILKPGEYNGEDKNRLPSITQDGFHANLTMAPYSKLLNKHLLTHLSYPPDTELEFKQHFQKLIDSFGAQELADKGVAAKNPAPGAKD